ncbi:20902_t:CDS:2, partial [Racocetra persica]
SIVVIEKVLKALFTILIPFMPSHDELEEPEDEPVFTYQDEYEISKLSPA